MEPDKPGEDRRLRCALCLKEIPVSAAVSAEARDYTWYFCGLDCFERWKQQAAADGKPAE